MPLAHASLCTTAMFADKVWGIVHDSQGRAFLACDYNPWRTHEGRIALRERLGLGGDLGQSCRTVARANAKEAARRSQQQSDRRARPRTTKAPPK